MLRSATRLAIVPVAAGIAFAAGLAFSAAPPAAARTAADPTTAGAPAYALAPGQMAVSAVTARYFKSARVSNKLEQNCSVVVTDSSGNPVDGATVTISMTNDWVATLNVLTAPQPNWNGEVFAHVARTISGQCGKKGLDAFTCTVTNVTHPSLTYVPSENLATSSTDGCN